MNKFAIFFISELDPKGQIIEITKKMIIDKNTISV